MFNRRKKRADELEEMLVALELEATEPTTDAVSIEISPTETQPEAVDLEAADVAEEAEAADVPDVVDVAEEAEAADVAEADDEADEAGEPGGAEYDREPHERDPYIGWMLMVSLGLIIVILVSTVALVFYLLALRGAPRTTVERTVAFAEAAVEQTQNKENMLQLARAYMLAGRYGDAKRTIERGRRLEDTSAFDLAEGDLLRAQEDFEGALEVYKAGMEVESAEASQTALDFEAKGISMAMQRPIRVSLLIGAGECAVELGDLEQATVYLREAAQREPTNTFVLGRLGDLYFDAGKLEEAKEHYEAALRYVPDYQPALDGLKRIESSEEQD